MKKKYLLLFLIIYSICNGQETKCPKVALNNNKSAWGLVSYTVKKYDKEQIPSKEDIDLYLCVMKQLDQIGEKKATSFLAQGYLYGFTINGGKNLEEAEKYFIRLSDTNDFQDIGITKKNLITSLKNLYIEKNKGSEGEKKLISILKKRADKFDDELSSYYVGDYYRFEKGYEKQSIFYLEKACNLGNNQGCELFNVYKKNPSTFFNALKATTGLQIRN